MDALMSRLEQGDGAAFEQLCKALTSPDNEARRQAEVFYKQLFDTKSDLGVRYLCGGLSDEKPDMKHFCCVYLRKAVRATGVWDACTNETKELVKMQGIKCLAGERNAALMHMLADCMSQVAAQTWGTGAGRWTGILQHMQQFITSEDPAQVEVGLVLFTKLTEWLDQEDLLQQNPGQMYDVLIRCMGHSSRQVQIAACKASICFVTSFEDENMKLKLDGIIPPLFTVVSAQLHSGNEMDVRDILLDLLDIAEGEPRLFKRNCREHLSLLLAVMSGRDPSNPSLALDSETRQSALELVVTLVENRPQLVRKDEAQMRAICESLMALLLEIEDTPAWHTAIEEEDLDDGQSELYECALQGLDRIAKPIGGKFLLANLWPLIEQWAKDGDWRRRAGALCAIAQVAEGCRNMLLPQGPLQALMTICCEVVTDSHPIVKWAACQAIGQICTDLATKVQRKHHAAMMGALMHLMNNSEEPRVQSHAASAIVNFCEGLGDDDSGNIVGLYLQPLTERLMVLLQSGNQLAVEAALTATSSIADGVGELFKPYYGATMPLLKHILTHANDRTQRRLCGKTLECISLIAMSVGKETFYGDAHEFLKYLQQLNTMDVADDDPLVTYVQSAGTRMCKCLGDDFVPMLATFVPPLIKSAGKKSAYQMVNADEVDDEDDENYNNFPIGDQIFRVSTAGTEEKTNALSMLSCYAEHMGEHFAPYCLDIATIAEHVLSAPLLNTELMRRTCATLVPQLLRCMQAAVEKKSLPQATPDTVLQLFQLLMKGLLAAMDCEVDLEVLHDLYTALEETLDDVDDALITPALLESFFAKIEMRVKHLLASRQERLDQKADEDFEEEDLELLDEAEEQEEELLQQVASAIGAFLKRMGDTALPCVEKLMAEYLNPLMVDPARRPEERWVPLLVVSDCIEHAPSSAKHLPSVLPQIATNAQSDRPELVQVCVYTLGVIAEKYPAVYVQHHSTLLPIVLKAIEGHLEEEEWQQARDNAVGALGHILYNHENLTNGAQGMQLASVWLNCLPLYGDEEEAGKQHELLHKFLLANDSRIIGGSNSNLPKIADVFVKVIGRGDSLLPEEHAQAFRQFFLQQMRPVLESHGCNLQELVRQLEPKDQYRFTAALQEGSS